MFGEAGEDQAAFRSLVKTQRRRVCGGVIPIFSAMVQSSFQTNSSALSLLWRGLDLDNGMAVRPVATV
jgi:hypothetical protein